MAAKPKLTPEQWVDVRARWEADEREGFAWLVDELGLPVSAPGVRKKALSDGWRKVAVAAPAQKVAKVSQGAPAKVSRKVSQTIAETLPETMPVRAAEAIERGPDQFGALTQLPEKRVHGGLERHPGGDLSWLQRQQRIADCIPTPSETFSSGRDRNLGRSPGPALGGRCG